MDTQTKTQTLITQLQERRADYVEINEHLMAAKRVLTQCRPTSWMMGNLDTLIQYVHGDIDFYTGAIKDELADEADEAEQED